MEITDVRLDLLDNPRGKLQAFCSLTIDDKFVVKNFKIIEGNNGLFVAMPSRKLTKPCYECDNRVFRNANYCDNCGNKFSGGSEKSSNFKNEKFHADIAFPITDEFRNELEETILDAYRRETTADGGIEVDHQQDEDYDMLDFEYEPDEKEKEPEPKKSRRKSESIPESGRDVFSVPGAYMTAGPREETEHENTGSERERSESAEELAEESGTYY